MRGIAGNRGETGVRVQILTERDPPAIQLMQQELGLNVLNPESLPEWSLLRQTLIVDPTNIRGYEGQGGGVSDLGRDGKREVVLTGAVEAGAASLESGSADGGD